MKHWLRSGSMTLTLIVSLGFFAGDASAYTMTSTEGGFSVEFNAKPEFRTEEEVDAKGQKLKFFLWELSQGERMWLVTYNEFKPGTIEEIGMDQAYKNTMQGSQEGSGARQISADPIVRSGISGWDLISSLPTGFVMRQWIFIKGDQLFQISYLGMPRTEKQPPVQQFLESFKLDPPP